MERYDILERLAVGGMGEVFLARQRGQGGFARTVVVKQLLPDAAEEGESARRLLDEARLASSVAHENVVTVHEVGIEDGRPFLAMEYVHGVALSVLTRRAERRGGPLPPMVAARITFDVARGLHAAHVATDATGRALGIIHRDVAPKNVLVRHDGLSKVTDFGVAAGADRLCRTATGAVPGTLSYMAPEQAGAAETSPRSDQFALGVVLWELLTGERLFRADTPSETLRRLFDLDIAAPSSVPARHARAIPKALDAVVLRMLARNPHRRFADLAQAARALDQAMPGVSGDAARAEVARAVAALAGDELARRRTRLENVDDNDDGRTLIITTRGEPPTPLTPLTPLTNAVHQGATRVDGLGEAAFDRRAPRRRVPADAATRRVAPSSSSSSPLPASMRWSRARVAVAASIAVLLTLTVGGAAGMVASSQLGGLDREALTRAYLAEERVNGPVVYAATLGEYADERGVDAKVADPVVIELERLMAERLIVLDAHWQKDQEARTRSDAALDQRLLAYDAQAKAVLAVWPADLAKRALADTKVFGRAPGEWLHADMMEKELAHMVSDARKNGPKEMKKALVRAARRADVDQLAVQDAMWPLQQLFLARVDAAERLHKGDGSQAKEIEDIDARAKTLVAERFPAHFFLTAYSLWRTRGDLGEPGEPVPGFGPALGDNDDRDDDDRDDDDRDADDRDDDLERRAAPAHQLALAQEENP